MLLFLMISLILFMSSPNLFTADLSISISLSVHLPLKQSHDHIIITIHYFICDIIFMILFFLNVIYLLNVICLLHFTCNLFICAIINIDYKFYSFIRFYDAMLMLELYRFSIVQK